MKKKLAKRTPKSKAAAAHEGRGKRAKRISTSVKLSVAGKPVDDVKWFANNPMKSVRTRAATAIEALAYGLRKGTKMLVVRGSGSRVVRVNLS